MSTNVQPAIGIDLGGTKIEALLLDANGHERWRRRVPTPRDDYAGVLQAVCALVKEARAMPGAQNASVGMAHPGAETPSGRIKNSNSTCLNGQVLRADLEAALGTPLAMTNDANCLAMSEATDGAGAGAAVVFAVILGTGVGGGIAVHGRVLAGANGIAGEWGHNPLPWLRVQDGAPRPCYCGQVNCIEAWLSGPALARRHGEQVSRQSANPHRPTPAHLHQDAQAIAAAAAAGDATCLDTLAAWHGQLARSLASVINLLDPDVIVLGGGLSGIASTYAVVPSLWSAWVVSAGSASPPVTRLRAAAHGDSSGIRGAAWLGAEAQARARA